MAGLSVSLPLATVSVVGNLRNPSQNLAHLPCLALRLVTFHHPVLHSSLAGPHASTRRPSLSNDSVRLQLQHLHPPLSLLTTPSPPETYHTVTRNLKIATHHLERVTYHLDMVTHGLVSHHLYMATHHLLPAACRITSLRLGLATW